MLASVDDNNDSELNAPEFADFQRIVRARAVETSAKALKVCRRTGLLSPRRYGHEPDPPPLGLRKGGPVRDRKSEIFFYFLKTCVKIFW